MIDCNPYDRINNFINRGEDYDIEIEEKPNEIIFRCELRPFNNRPGNLFVKFSAWVSCTYYEMKQEDV